MKIIVLIKIKNKMRVSRIWNKQMKTSRNKKRVSHHDKYSLILNDNDNH